MKQWATKPLSFAVAFLLPVVALAIPPKYDVQQLPSLQQEEQHEVASKRVTSFFTRYHFNHMELNNALSEKIEARYIKMLDYNKMFFLAEDIKKYEEYRHLFDEMLNNGELDIAYQIYTDNLERRFERYTYALSLLDPKKPMDFTEANDKYYYDREDAKWATSKEELNEIWHDRVKYDALNLKLAGKDWPEITETLGKRYNSALHRLTQSESEDVFQTLMNAFARSIDAHTSYLSPRNAERFQQDMNLQLEGIGAVLQAEYDYTVIRSLVPGGPADKTDKLDPEDKIIGVAQGAAGSDDAEDFVDVIGWRLDDVVDLIKGPKGTAVRLQILKSSQGAGGTPKVVEIVRDTVKLEDRAAKAEVKIPDSGPNKGRKMGVIDVPGFYNGLTEDVKGLLADLKKQDVEGVIVDLRGNGGGALTEAIGLTGLFIDKGPVVQVSDGRGRVEVSRDDDGETYYDGPLVVLVNRYSASASEIFAAAMQDYQRALIVGENTFGKGSVQQHRSLNRRFDFFENPLGSIQYTIAKFYRVDGGSTQIKGVEPDIKLPAFVSPSETGEAVEDNALPWDQIAQAEFKPTKQVSKAEVKKLQKDTNLRIEKDPEFKYIFADIDEYQREKDKTWVSLVLAEREQEQKEEQRQKLKRVNERLQRLGMEPVKTLENAPEKATDIDPYLNETISVAFDYLDDTKEQSRG
ncbi:carboxy terminal-processing peptidase [Idiomarina tyrosinivorans]|uniref:Carboxy terminal-processing peptidase n=1 Tax=Idiomarina tyrosinivorans TaxID=1445662 RepID=A0A432ZTP8_9GAMM|nr:carboxy terminal-processing peptidase [Idiomarina tyrosinivorans]RUO81290.1 carboxy terminal-processing peptidase [Idiomarina tyrosinivorans]